MVAASACGESLRLLPLMSEGEGELVRVHRSHGERGGKREGKGARLLLTASSHGSLGELIGQELTQHPLTPHQGGHYSIQEGSVPVTQTPPIKLHLQHGIRFPHDIWRGQSDYSNPQRPMETGSYCPSDVIPFVHCTPAQEHPFCSTDTPGLLLPWCLCTLLFPLPAGATLLVLRGLLCPPFKTQPQLLHVLSWLYLTTCLFVLTLMLPLGSRRGCLPLNLQC